MKVNPESVEYTVNYYEVKETKIISIKNGLEEFSQISISVTVIKYKEEKNNNSYIDTNKDTLFPTVHEQSHQILKNIHNNNFIIIRMKTKVKSIDLHNLNIMRKNN